MSLRLKLLLVALSTLTLPWAGWQFVRQTESVLRQGQEQTLLASATTLARALEVMGVEAPPRDAALYVHPLVGRLSVDGYDSDWQAMRPFAQTFAVSGNAQKLTVMLAGDDQWLYLFARVLDTTRQRADARDAASAHSDHMDLRLLRDGQARQYRIASAAPGRFEAPAIDGDASFPPQLVGAWQEDGSGYSIELRLARADAPDHLSLAVHDSALPETGAAPVLALLGYDDKLAHTLQRLVPQHSRVRLVSADGWLLAVGGALGSPGKTVERNGGFADFIYRNLLAPKPSQTQAADEIEPRLRDAELAQVLAGTAQTAWHGDVQGGVLLLAAVPLQGDDGTRGALVLEQSNPMLPNLASQALSSLLGASLLALAVSAGLLLLFGGLLSWRIRRLRNATERATRAGGTLSGPLPLTASTDELGDLARSFARLFDEVGGHTEYLRTLASKLSHELNTPLAIVKSSLDNLDHQRLPADAQPYLERARDGADRLGGIVRAMSESSRVERAIATADGEDFDLRALVTGCADGYRGLFSGEMHLSLPDSPVPFHGSPELLAQALDKLFDNARSFAGEDGRIAINLREQADELVLSMSNSGPLLPEGMRERLFDSLVSLREHSQRAAGEAPHLGLGLSVVRLVAELHLGRASAANLADGSGVVFDLHLVGMPRRRMGRDAHT